MNLKMKDKIGKMIIASTLALSIVTPALAYSKTLVLPRTGVWKTIVRPATGPVQYTSVFDNEYDVLSCIGAQNDGRMLSSYRTHKSVNNKYNGYAQKHVTNIAKGTRIFAQFKTSKINYKTCKCTIEWQP